jgi:hypothetical protein
MYGMSQGIFTVDMALIDDVEEGIFHGEGAGSPGYRYLLMQVLQRIAPNMLTGSVADHQEFRYGNAAS